MTGAEVVAVLALGLLGSVHCLGMCGAFVLCVAGGVTPCEGRGRHALYQAGRLLAYAGLGAVLAGAGGATLAVTSPAGARWILAAAGGLMTMMGLHLWGWRVPWSGLGVAWRRGPIRTAEGSLRIASGGLLQASDRLRSASLTGLLRQDGRLAAFGIGAMTGILPCGLLYAALLRAATSGSALQGGLVMAVFWAGTLPVLAGAGVLLPLTRTWLPRWWPRLAGATVVLLGLLTVAHALAPAGVWVPAWHAHTCCGP